MFGVITLRPFVPLINVNNPHDAIIPSPTVFTGIADPFIVSINANAECTCPPGELITSVNSFGLVESGNKFFSIIA